MPNTSTASWTTFVAATKAKASEVNGNFDFAEANLWPHSTGTKVDKTYSLGDTDASWLNVYAHNIIGGSTGVTVGTTTATQPTSTAMEVAGTKAFLMPRLTTTERDALTAVNGMVIYNETTELWNFYENGTWRVMANQFGFEATDTTAETTTATTVLSITSAGVFRGAKLVSGNPSTNVIVSIILDGITMSADLQNASTTVSYVTLVNNPSTGNYLTLSTDPTDTANMNAVHLPFKTSFKATMKGNNPSNTTTAHWHFELPT